MSTQGADMRSLLVPRRPVWAWSLHRRTQYLLDFAVLITAYGLTYLLWRPERNVDRTRLGQDHVAQAARALGVSDLLHLAQPDGLVAGPRGRAAPRCRRAATRCRLPVSRARSSSATRSSWA